MAIHGNQCKKKVAFLVLNKCGQQRAGKKLNSGRQQPVSCFSNPTLSRSGLWVLFFKLTKREPLRIAYVSMISGHPESPGHHLSGNTGVIRSGHPQRVALGVGQASQWLTNE
jgi:hypothetical protein